MSKRNGQFRFKLIESVYRTPLGTACCGNSSELLDELPDASVDLLLTSPPFALLRKKEYGNEDQAEYVDWLCSFGPKIKRVLKETGSLVIDLGGAYRKGVPVRSLYNYRVLIRLCDEVGFHLAEEFFWHNTSKLPSPIEWVNKRKIRVKDSVNTVWWLSRSENPKADVRNVLAPYSNRMNKLLENPEAFYKPKTRPSGHDIASSFGKNNGGAIPPNLLQISNSESNSSYLRRCKELGAKPHPARFPAALPEFFIKFLTDPKDLVVDIFAGSNTTGEVAERLGRRWLACDLRRDYVVASGFRFIDTQDVKSLERIYETLADQKSPAISLTGEGTLFQTQS